MATSPGGDQAARRPRLRLAAAAAFALLLLAPGASGQFIPYYGKNKVKYDDFAWRVYRSPHFEIYYYPEFEQHLARLVSYAESAYQKVSSELKHEISFAIPLIFYKTSSEFQQTNLFPDFVPEGVLAFAEPVRDRMVIPIDEPPDRLQGLITHELTHIFEFDIIPRSLLQRGIPLWVDEGLADYMRGAWDNLDLASIRDVAVTDQVPRMSKLGQGEDAFANGRVPYNLGHAAFEYMEARYGKEGIRQFLYTLRKNIVGGGIDDVYMQAFRIKAEEFDRGFEKWIKERFKGYRDKQRPTDYGRDLSPDSAETPYTQVLGFAPSPSGEVIAALTGNRSEGEIDVVLLSTQDGSVIRNLTSGYTGDYEFIALNLSARAFGRSLSFSPSGDALGFFGRTGKRRSLFVMSPLTGKTLRRVPIELDEASAPCLLADGRHALFTALKEGVSDIYLLDLETGEARNLTQDAFYDSNPQVSPDGRLVVYSRRVSGHEKLYAFPLTDPARKTQLTFGTHNDVTPTFASDTLVYYVSDEEDDIYQLRRLDLETGVISHLTDALGGNLMPGVVPGKVGRAAFVTYFKGEYRLHGIEPEPIKEVEQEVRATAEEILDFQPDVQHQVVPENKRRKKLFEKLYLEGRPPVNLAVTSSGDFFGGTQLTLSDVLGDQNFSFLVYSFRDFRTYEGGYVNLAKRLRFGASVFDTTRFYYPSYYIPQYTYAREGALFTSRYTGGNLFAQYPLDKYHRLDFGVGAIRIKEQYEDPAVDAFVRELLAAQGLEPFANNGTFLPLSLNLVRETTRFREFGPLDGSTVALASQVSPGISGVRSRYSASVDLRKYLRLGSSALFAARFRGFYSGGDSPDIFYFGGNMELRGYEFYSFAGNKGFFTNLEFRFPIVHVMATPIGLLGPIRGSLYAGMGGASFKGQSFTFWTKEPGLSYVDDPIFGEPVSGRRLVDGRASFGFGFQIFFLGYPMHFDWTRFTDLQNVSNDSRFNFWMGFDF